MESGLINIQAVPGKDGDYITKQLSNVLYANYINKSVLSDIAKKSYYLNKSFAPEYNYTTVNSKNTSKKIFISLMKKKYIIKEIPWYNSNREYVNGMTLVLKKLRDMKAPVQKIICTNENQPFLELENNGIYKYYVMLDYIEGSAYSENPLQIQSCMNAIIKLHGLFSEFDLGLNQNFKTYNVFSFASDILKTLLKHLENKKNNGLIRNSERSIIDWIYISENLILEYSCCPKSKGYYKDKFLVHGDCNPSNFVFNKENAVNVILDFDNLCLDNPISDIIRFLLHIFYFNAIFNPKMTFYNSGVVIEALNIYKEQDYNNYANLMEYGREVIHVMSIELMAIAILNNKIATNLLSSLSNICEEVTNKLFNFVQRVFED